MKKDGRYDISGLTEAQFEPGSSDLVLKNRLGITSPQEMDVAEARALDSAMSKFIGSYDESRRFMVTDICALHKDWLGEIYDWGRGISASEYQQGRLPVCGCRSSAKVDG